MKVAFLSNFTIDFIAKEYKKRTDDTKIYISGYNQYYLDIINKQSEFYKFKPDFTVLILDGNTLFENRKLSEVKREITDLFEVNSQNSNSYFVVSNIIIDSALNNLYNYNRPKNQKQIQAKFNLFLNKMACLHDRFYVLDVLSLIEQHGRKNIYDNSLWLYGKIRYNKQGIQVIAEKLDYLIKAVLNQSKKCLVLDLDNTLWGGVIGEDGIDGIKLGKGEIGNIYFNFQKRILEIKKKGVLLTLCSKNNINDAKEVFAKHEYCALKWDDFIIKKVNWKQKDLNIKEIAQELNIGEDSLVFLDDNPFEREIVRTNTSAVVPDFPDSVENLQDFILEIDEKYFSKMKITKEDKEKTKQYIDNVKRNEVKTVAKSLEEYVKTLKMELTIEKFKKENLARISQMTQKTNQFNFTTLRYSEKDILEFANNPSYLIFTGKVKDKFGDYGIVILLIAEIKNKQAFINTFLMSCRVIGRYVEHCFMSKIIEVLNLKGVEKIFAQYIPSPKNMLVKEKFEEMGFELVKIRDNETKEYVYHINKLNKTNNAENLIQVVYEN
jgi:FkbH-like protein